MAKGAISNALAAQADVFRLGYGRINQPNVTTACKRKDAAGACVQYKANLIDDVQTSVLNAGVRDFTAATRSNVLTWLYGLPGDGGTPLRSAVMAVGRYYQRNDARGPWTDDPSVKSNQIASNKSCRRAYDMLVTDGYWNEDDTLNVGNQDGSASPPYSDSEANTLADVAMMYWKHDLCRGWRTT